MVLPSNDTGISVVSLIVKILSIQSNCADARVYSTNLVSSNHVDKYVDSVHAAQFVDVRFYSLAFQISICNLGTSVQDFSLEIQFKATWLSINVKVSTA
ncbi:hypothetical protein T01_4166 [Trichinella spiralis]|uniref:Uncharacterized protein n=1 Tax=Trichinella spiralis TaxID=6334 RepID=A0A0V1BG30_TRISP|nr:hypothetical protein T01_4166 [Trichinella spiralis]